MQRKIRILNITVVVLIVLQMVIYFNYATGEHKVISGTAEFIGYFIFLNLFLLIAACLFAISLSLRSKMIRRAQDEMIDSIGRPE